MTSLNLSTIRPIFSNWRIIAALTKREILGRYQGSILGLFWSFLNPLVMLIVYTFVFSVVFKARWNQESDSQIEFAIILFIGLMVYNLISETLLKSSNLIVSNTNFVKKVVFPLEILSIITVLSALFHLAISFLVWLLVYIIFYGTPHYSIIFFPIILIPLSLFALGASWCLSALGVYFRDLGQIIALITTMLMFLSPIFYPVTALPVSFQIILNLNPLTFLIEQARSLLMEGQHPDWAVLTLTTLGSLIISYLGLLFFKKVKSGFADVL